MSGIAKDNAPELAVRSDLLNDPATVAEIMIHEDARLSGLDELGAQQESIKFSVWKALGNYYPSAEEATDALVITENKYAGITKTVEDSNRFYKNEDAIRALAPVFESVVTNENAPDRLRINSFYALTISDETFSHSAQTKENPVKSALSGIRSDEKTMNFLYKQVALEDDFSAVLPAIKQYFSGDYSLPLAMAAYNNYNNIHDLHTHEGPRALLLLPKYDYQNPYYHFYSSGALLARDLGNRKEGSMGNQVMVYVVPDETSFIQAIQSATGYNSETGISAKPVDTMVMSGHGKKGYFRLGSESDTGMIDTTDKKELIGIQPALKPRGTIIINSCSTGEGGLKAGNLANTIANTFPQAKHVFATDTLSYGLDVTFDVQGLVQSVDLEAGTTWDFALSQRPGAEEGLVSYVNTIAAVSNGTVGEEEDASKDCQIKADFGENTYYVSYIDDSKASEAAKKLAALDKSSTVKLYYNRCIGCTEETYYGKDLAPNAPAVTAVSLLKPNDPQKTAGHETSGSIAEGSTIMANDTNFQETGRSISVAGADASREAPLIQGGASFPENDLSQGSVNREKSYLEYLDKSIGSKYTLHGHGINTFKSILKGILKVF